MRGPWTLLTLVCCLAACRTTLTEKLPVQRGAPELEAGFYTVHAVVDGRIAEEPIAGVLGEILFLCPQEYVHHARIVSTAEALIDGVRGVFLPDGEIWSVLRAGEVVHRWEADGRGGDLVLREHDEPGTLLIELGEQSQTHRYALRYYARRIATEQMPAIFLAHRGSYRGNMPPLNPDGIYPSNTMPAFEAALRSGYAGFEMDVQVTADYRFVVSHDLDLSVATDGEGLTTEKSLEQLETLKVVKSASIPEKPGTAIPAYFAAPLPALDEVLERYLDDPRVEHLVVDIKPESDTKLFTALGNAFGRYRDSPHFGKLIFLSRSGGFALAVRRFLPGARCALEGKIGTEAATEMEEFIPELAGKPGAAHDTVSCGVYLLFSPFRAHTGKKQWAALLENARRYGYDVIGWTVNDANRMEILRRSGHLPDFVLSDAPYSRVAMQRLLAFDDRKLHAR